MSPNSNPFVAPVAPLRKPRRDDFVCDDPISRRASVLQRSGAALIDIILAPVLAYVAMLVVFLPLVVLIYAWAFFGPIPFDPDTSGGRAVLELSASLFLFASMAWYFVGFESSTRGATLGKRYFGIRVVTDQGRRVGRSRALLRLLVKIVTTLPVPITLVWIALRPDRQALHDRVSSTVVIQRPTPDEMLLNKAQASDIFQG